MIPFLEKLDGNSPKKYFNIVVEAGYEIRENYVYLDKNGQNSFVKPQAYEGMKKANFKRNIGKRENIISPP
jgi:hypothetical protein